MEFQAIRRRSDQSLIYQFKLHPKTRAVNGKTILALDERGNFTYCENMIPLVKKQHTFRKDGIIEGWLTQEQYDFYMTAREGLSEILNPIADF